MCQQRRAKPAGTDRSKLLGLRQRMENVEAVGMPAEFLRVVEPQDAGLGSLFVEVARQFALGFPAIDVRCHFLRDEAAHALRHGLVAFVIIR